MTAPPQKNLSKSKTYTLKIDKLVYQGIGLGNIDGFKVFVPKTAPGDIVEVRLTKRKRHFAEGKVIQVIERSPLRTDSPCTHFPECGGCQIIDIAYPDQLQIKEQILQDGIQQFIPEHKEALRPIIGAKESTFYRNKMEYSFGLSDDKISLGLKKRGHFDQVIPTPNCQLQSETSNQIRAVAETFFNQKKATVWNYHTHTGLLRYLVIRHSKTHDNYLLNLIMSEKNLELALEFANEITAKFDNVAAVFCGISSSKGDTAHTADIHHLYGDEHISESFNGINFDISPLSFFQTNTTQAEVLYNKIIEIADFKSTDKVLDLYCGTGSISFFMSPHVKEVIGIEENTFAVDNAISNAYENNFTNTTFMAGRVKNILKNNPLNPDVIVLDPPRSGTVPKALNRIIEQQANTIVYVSCNPITLFRDLQVLCETYTLELIVPVDQFPNTFHIECIAKLTKKP